MTQNPIAMKTTISLLFFVFCLFVSKAQFFPDTLTLCEDSVLVIEAPFSGVTYQWSNGSTDSSITVNSPGIYSLTITDSNAVQQVDSTYAKFQYLPIANFGVDSVSWSSIWFKDCSSFASSYSWDFDDGDSSTLTDPLHIYALSDSLICYDVKLTVVNHCGIDSLTRQLCLFEFDGDPVEMLCDINGEKETQNSIGWTVYPNPSQGLLSIKFSNEIPEGTLTVSSLSGEVVFETNTMKASHQLDLSHLPKGVYILSVTDGNEKRVEKLILY